MHSKAVSCPIAIVQLNGSNGIAIYLCSSPK